MIEQAEAANQVRRMAGLDRYPRGKDQDQAAKELRKAAQNAASPAILERVISNWLEVSNRCPTPGELRHQIWEENEKVRVKRENCQLCDGVGFITIWQIITYRGNSLSVERKEDLPDIHSEMEAYEFQRKINANPGTLNQIVLSAAKRCACRMAA